MNSRILIKRIFLITLLTIITLLVISFGLFSYYKDDIAKIVLLKVNSVQDGELVLEDISFNPFVYFPKVSIDLNEVSYYEQQAAIREPDAKPIVDLDHLYLSFDLIDLIRGDVNISSVHLEDGAINLVKHADSTFNLTRAFGVANDSTATEIDSQDTSATAMMIDLKQVICRNISINYQDILANKISKYDLNHLKAKLTYRPDSILCFVSADILLKEEKLGSGLRLSDKEISIETSLIVDREKERVLIEPSILSFERANFTLNGSLDLVGNGYIDLELTGADKDFSILAFALSVQGIENIEKGDLLFTGSVRGPIYTGIPLFSLNFGMKEVAIRIPGSNDYISDLNLDGEFSSGSASNFSEAILKINNLSGQLPGGKVEGNVVLANLVHPVIELDIYLKTNMKGIDNLLDMNIDSLDGAIEASVRFAGKYDSESEIFNENEGQLLVRFDSASFSSPSFGKLKHLNGRIAANFDTLHFNDLRFNYGKSDFHIYGSMVNVFQSAFVKEKTITGQLRIKSNVYDFPDFFAWDSTIANAFPYRIRDINLVVNPSTSFKALTNFYRAPHIAFDIEYLEAEIESFLPPVSIHVGQFVLGDQDSSLHLDFKDFKIKLAGSALQANMDYYSPPVEPDWFTIDLQADSLKPDKTFVHWFDMVPEFLDGELNGKLSLEMMLSLDDETDFDKLDLKANKLNYINKKDTFDCYNLRLDTRDVSYNLEESDNFFEQLSFDMKFTADTLSTNYFTVEEIDDDIIANEGIYQILPKNAQFFDKLAKGDVLLKPFQNPPVYEFRYAVKQFDVAKMFSTFREDTILTGKMDLDLELILAGAGWDEIKQNLNGNINIQGSDLHLHGLDLDKLIERFKRSQRFTLADVGAVILMGPAGILVTKGTDYARIIMMNPGEISEVSELSSHWKINTGVVDLTDVAFATNENRMAARGLIDLGVDTLALEIALVNPEGCLVLGQTLTGQIKDPELGKVKVVKSLFAPVTNLAKSVTGTDCEVFYKGNVKPPEKVEKQDKDDNNQ